MKNPVEKYTEQRPWGKFEQFTRNQRTTVKIITIEPGQILSLQYHSLRDEFWHILEGEALVTVGMETVSSVLPGAEFFIPRKTLHRIGSLRRDKGVKFLEIAFGKFDESDIVRVEDRYGRNK